MRRLIFLAFLLLAGCSSYHGATAQLDAPQAHPQPYVSRVDDPHSQALYHFGAARLQAADGDLHGALDSLKRAAAIDPDSHYLQLSLARLYLETGEDDKALRTAERVLERHPESAQAHMLLGNILFHKGLDEDAVAYFRRAVEIDPEEENARLHLGIAYARVGEFAKASETLRTLIELHPDSLAAEITLARLYRESGLLLLAEEYYLRILDKEPGFEPVVLELGGLYESRGDIDKALALYRTLPADHHAHHEVAHYVVRLLILQERLDEALLELDSLVEEHPEDLEAWRKIGLIHLEQNNWKAASEAFSLILESDPGLEQVRYYLGTSLEGQGEWLRALEIFQGIPADSSLYPDALAHLGYIYQRLDRTDEAISLLETNLDSLAVRPRLYGYLASLHETRESYENALRVLDGALERFPDDVDLLYHQGIVYEQMEERDEALLVMHRILDLDPEYAEALNYIAYTWAERNENLEEALRMALEAVALKEDAGHILDTLGWIYFRLGRFDEARVQLERAVEHLPDDPLVHQHHGEILHALGENDRARAAFERSLALDPDNEEVVELLRGVSERE